MEKNHFLNICSKQLKRRNRGSCSTILSFLLFVVYDIEGEITTKNDVSSL